MSASKKKAVLAEASRRVGGQGLVTPKAGPQREGGGLYETSQSQNKVKPKPVAKDSGVKGPTNVQPTQTQVVHQPPVTPFLTPDQQQEANDKWTAQQNSLSDLNYQLGGDQANTSQQAGGRDQQGHLDHTGILYQNMLQNREAADASLIARGLFQSSIRDGDLADIEATTAARRQSMIDALALHAAHNDQIRHNLADDWDRFQNVQHQRAVQNAAAIPVVPDAVTKTPAKTIPPTQQNTVKPKPVASNPGMIPKPITGIDLGVLAGQKKPTQRNTVKPKPVARGFF